MHIMKFMGTHAHSNGRVTLDRQFQKGKCGQIRGKLRKICLLNVDTLYWRGPVSNLLQLSGRICYQTRQKS